MATSPAFTANAIAGAYQVSAQVTGLHLVNFSLTNTESLSISAIHASPIFQGGPGVITLTVTTSGATTAVATVSDTIDSNFTMNSASAGCSISSQTVTCTMPAGSTSTTFTIYVTVATNAPGSLSNTATLTDTGADDSVTTGSSTDSITISPQAPQVDSSLKQLVLSGSTDSPPCAPGGTLTATDLLMNTSGSTLTNRTPRLTRSPKATCCSRIRPVPPAWRQIRT